jgi:hypothetical protein
LEKSLNDLKTRAPDTQTVNDQILAQVKEGKDPSKLFL